MRKRLKGKGGKSYNWKKKKGDAKTSICTGKEVKCERKKRLCRGEKKKGLKGGRDKRRKITARIRRQAGGRPF